MRYFYRSKQYPNLASHKGYDDDLCHGDVTLHLQHQPHSLSRAERRRILQIKRRTEDAVEQRLHELSEQKHEESIRKLVKASEHDASNNHRFTGVKFNTATFCNFCHKKIWFKSGFKCDACHMICHKKCTDKCQAQTTCSKYALVDLLMLLRSGKIHVHVF